MECASGLGGFCDCGTSGFGDDSDDEGWLRKTVCESSEVVDCVMLDLRRCLAVVPSDALGVVVCDEEDCWGRKR